MTQGGKSQWLVNLSALTSVPRFVVLSHSWIQQHSDQLSVAIKALLAENDLTGPYAVRSDSASEDGERSAFSGIFESRLSVADEDLLSAVSVVCTSAASPRLNAYLRARKISAVEVEMNVIIQEMVDAKVAGITFTRSPVSRERLRIEAVLGLGEMLLSGHAEPDVAEVQRSSEVIQTIRRVRQMRQLSLSAGEIRLSGQRAVAPKISRSQILAICQAALEIEQGWPDGKARDAGLDLECAIDQSETLYFLQARPITA